VPLVEKELLTLPEHQSSPPVFSGIHVAPSFVSMECFVEHYLSFFFWSSVLPVLLRLMASPHVISLSFLTIIIFFNFIHFQPIVYFVTLRFAPNKHSGLCFKSKSTYPILSQQTLLHFYRCFVKRKFLKIY